MTAPFTEVSKINKCDVIALSLGTKLKGHALRWPNPWGIKGGWLHEEHKAAIHVVCMYSIYATLKFCMNLFNLIIIMPSLVQPQLTCTCTTHTVAN